VAPPTPGEVRAVATVTDQDGVLSFYIDASPDRVSQDWAFTKRLRREVDGLAEATPALQRALPHLQAALAELLEVTDGHGRGRVLVAGLGGGVVRLLSLPVPVSDTMTVDSRAIALPLVQAAPTLARAGVVVLSRGGVRILEIAGGQPEELRAVTVEPSVDVDGNERRPGGARSAAGAEGYVRAVGDDVARVVRGQAARVRELSEQRGWGTVIVAGDPRLRELLMEHAAMRARVVPDDRDLVSLAPAAVAEAVEPHLVAERLQHERALLTHARDGAGAGGHGALGLNDVGGALFAGRVANLLLGDGQLPEAAVAPGGRIVDRAHPPDDVAGEELEPVDAPAEELARWALDTDAEVTCLPRGDLSDTLDALGGVAATLRW
jgi:Bacterial archaeo-eukaryotic release factor family 10